jgi:hypothetical protein
MGLPRVEVEDQLTVERLGRHEDEAAALRTIVLEDGRVLKKPIVSPRGEVVGEQGYMHLRSRSRAGADVRPARFAVNSD